MKTIVAALIVAAAMLVPTATATEDLGTPDLLTAACEEVSQAAATQPLVVTHCRRSAADDVKGNDAIVHLQLFFQPAWKGQHPQLHVDVYMHKSLWSLNGVVSSGG